MNVGYIRVSSTTQSYQSQLKAFNELNIDIEKIFEEKISGRTKERKELQRMMDFVRDGDTVYIYDFSRISRSLKDLLSIIDKLEKKNVKLVSIKENLNTNTSSGMFMVSILGAVNEYQINLQKEKQKDGIEEAKKQGKYKGRKKITLPNNWNENFEKWKKREITSKEFMENCNLKRTTFYKLLKEKDL
jgi:DNA invertase Pin-like site-specific DNA recombinase